MCRRTSKRSFLLLLLALLVLSTSAAQRKQHKQQSSNTPAAPLGPAPGTPAPAQNVSEPAVSGMITTSNAATTENSNNTTVRAAERPTAATHNETGLGYNETIGNANNQTTPAAHPLPNTVVNLTGQPAPNHHHRALGMFVCLRHVFDGKSHPVLHF